MNRIVGNTRYMDYVIFGWISYQSGAKPNYAMFPHSNGTMYVISSWMEIIAGKNPELWEPHYSFLGARICCDMISRY